MKTGKTGYIWLLGWLVALSVIVSLISGIVSANARQRREAVDSLEKSVKRAAVCCYSIEGRYPASLSYIEDNYGVYVDREKFLVYYEAFADNIMPYVEVRAR